MLLPSAAVYNVMGLEVLLFVSLLVSDATSANATSHFNKPANETADATASNHHHPTPVERARLSGHDNDQQTGIGNSGYSGSNCVTTASGSAAQSLMVIPTDLGEMGRYKSIKYAYC
jgi:hypothetical protein